MPAGAAWFGLTAAGTDAGALRRFLDRRGAGVYALGLIAADRDRTAAGLQRNGARLLVSAEWDQVFIHPATTHGVLIEIVAERRPAGALRLTRGRCPGRSGARRRVPRRPDP